MAASPVPTEPAGAATVPAVINPAQAKFIKGLAQLAREHQADERKIGEQYGAALSRLAKGAQQRGDLDTWKAAVNERKRFAQEKVPPPGTVGQEALDRLAKTIREAIEASAARHAGRVITLADQYDAYLDKQVKVQVRAGNMAVAEAIGAHQKQIDSVPAVASARFELAEAAATEGTASEDSDGSSADPVVGGPGATDEDDIPLKQDAGTVTPGRTGPSIAGTVFRRASLNATGQVSLNSPASARIEIATEDNVSNSSSSSSYYSSTRRSGNKSYRIRLYARSRTPERVISKAFVYVEYYGQPAGKQSGRTIQPVRVAARALTVPALDSTGLVCDFDPLAVHRSTSSYRYSSYSSSSGHELYGVLVTILDDKMNVLYQGTTKDNLKSFGNQSVAAATKHVRSQQVKDVYAAYRLAREAHYADMGNEVLRLEYEAARSQYHASRAGTSN